MLNSKILLTAASSAITSLAGSANAATGANQGDLRPVARQEFCHELHRPTVERVRVYDTLRLHHDRWISDPYSADHYVVRTFSPFGRNVLVKLNPDTGAFIGEFRI